MILVWSGPARTPISHHSEGLGREKLRPPGPKSSQNAMHRSSAMDVQEHFSEHQNRVVTAPPKTLAHFHFLAPPLSPPIMSESSGGQHTDRPEEWHRRASPRRWATLTRG
jgi:hypothetical protein